MSEKWDVVVVGAGIGGLACAASLARAGKKVIVLEGRRRVGGRATSFPIMEIPTEIGFHGLSAGGHTLKLLDKVGQSVPMIKLEPNFVIYSDKKFFEAPGKIEDFAKFDYIPKSDRAELVDLLRLIAGTSLEEAEDYDFMGWGDWIKEHTNSQAIYDFLALLGNIVITEEFTSNMSAGEVLRCWSLALHESGWSVYPRDGALIAISEAFAKAVKDERGEVRCNAWVREITVQDYVVKGVTVETAEGLLKLEAPIVISNFPVWDIFTLVAPDNFPRWFIDRTRFLEEHSQIAPRSSIGLSCIASQPLHPYKTAVLVPCNESVNRTGPSYVRWLSQPTNWVSSVAPQGKHLFQYGALWPRWYVDLARERRSIYEKEMNGLWEEIFAMFPDFKRDSIIWKGGGAILTTDLSMQFPGNAWKQRLDVKAPNVVGLYFVGDTVRGWGVAMDTAVCSAILCAERILKKKVL